MSLLLNNTDLVYTIIPVYIGLFLKNALALTINAEVNCLNLMLNSLRGTVDKEDDITL